MRRPSFRMWLIAVATIIMLSAVQPAFDHHPFIPESGLWALPPYHQPDVHAETFEGPRPYTITAAQQSGHPVTVDYVASIDIIPGDAPAV